MDIQWTVENVQWLMTFLLMLFATVTILRRLDNMIRLLEQNRRPSGLDRPPFLGGRREGSAPDERKM